MHQLLEQRLAHLHLVTLGLETTHQTLELDAGDGLDVLLTERVEHHRLVDPVDELLPEAASQHLHQHAFHLVVILLGVVLLDEIRP